jgi:hypothetical protein
MPFFGRPALGSIIQYRMEYLPELHRAFCDPSREPELSGFDAKDPFVIFAFM